MEIVLLEGALEGWGGIARCRRRKGSPVGFFQSSAACVFKGLSMLGSVGRENKMVMGVDEAAWGSPDRFPGGRGGASLRSHLLAGSGWRAGWS